jgi:hypothetical protein
MTEKATASNPTENEELEMIPFRRESDIRPRNREIILNNPDNTERVSQNADPPKSAADKKSLTTSKPIIKFV